MKEERRGFEGDGAWGQRDGDQGLARLHIWRGRVNFGTSVAGDQKTWTRFADARSLRLRRWGFVLRRKTGHHDGGMCHNSVEAGGIDARDRGACTTIQNYTEHFKREKGHLYSFLKEWPSPWDRRRVGGSRCRGAGGSGDQGKVSPRDVAGGQERWSVRATISRKRWRQCCHIHRATIPAARLASAQMVRAG